MTIPMPPRNTPAEVVARAADKCLRLACSKHYPTVLIGDVAEVASGGTPSTDRNDYWDGDILWVTPKDLGKPRNIEVSFAERYISAQGLASSSARLLPKGTVLLSSRAPIGHLGIAAQPLATNQGFKNIVCSKQLNNRFLFHILRGSIDELVSEGRGNTFMEIPGKVVKAFPIPLPPFEIQEMVAAFLDTLYLKVSDKSKELPKLPSPLAEQRRIVARIEELAAQIHEAQSLRQQATQEAEALITSSRGLYFRLSDECPSLAEVCTDVTDGTHDTPQYVDEGIPFLTGLNISPAGLEFNGARNISSEDHRRFSQHCPVEIGDVLITLIGTIDKVAIVETDRPFSIKNVGLIKPNHKCLNSRYLFQFIQSSTFQDQAVSYAKQAVQAFVGLKKLRIIRIPVPSLAEQQRIVSELDALQAEVDALKALQAETAAELDALLPSLLDRAFKGEL